jgi:hypothetical protein
MRSAPAAPGPSNASLFSRGSGTWWRHSGDPPRLPARAAATASLTRTAELCGGRYAKGCQCIPTPTRPRSICGGCGYLGPKRFHNRKARSSIPSANAGSSLRGGRGRHRRDAVPAPRDALLFELIADLGQPRVSAAVIEICAGRSSGADRAYDLVAGFDHHAAAEQQQMRQSGEQGRRGRLSRGALDQCLGGGLSSVWAPVSIAAHAQHGRASADRLRIAMIAAGDALSESFTPLGHSQPLRSFLSP